MYPIPHRRYRSSDPGWKIVHTSSWWPSDACWLAQGIEADCRVVDMGRPRIVGSCVTGWKHSILVSWYEGCCVGSKSGCLSGRSGSSCWGVGWGVVNTMLCAMIRSRRDVSTTLTSCLVIAGGGASGIWFLWLRLVVIVWWPLRLHRSIYTLAFSLEKTSGPPRFLMNMPPASRVLNVGEVMS
jgi:hypothetical protein